MKPRMKLPESVEKELEGLSDANRFQKVMGRLVKVKPEQVKAQEQQTREPLRGSPSPAMTKTTGQRRSG